MQDKLIAMSFNADNFLNKHKQIWKYHYLKSRGNYFIHTALALFILLIGIKIDDSAPFPTGTLIGAVYCLYVGIIWSIFFQGKRKYFKNIKKYSGRYQQKQLKYNYIFSDFGIAYEDEEKSQKAAWALLKSVVNFHSVLLIVGKDSDQVLFSIGKNEISDSEYTYLQELLKQKLGQ
nr:hypothetical protein [uncultured Mucilaginibacter sp.]